MELEAFLPEYKTIYDLNSSVLFNKIKELNTVKVVDLLIDETMEMVSIRVYKSPDYWEALSLYNDIIDPFNPEEQTRTLRIPSKADLDSLLNKVKVKSDV